MGIDRKSLRMGPDESVAYLLGIFFLILLAADEEGTEKREKAGRDEEMCKQRSIFLVLFSMIFFHNVTTLICSVNTGHSRYICPLWVSRIVYCSK